ncbi:prepilin-type N-terminal cleavage/methylation domain-containing protein [Candidatus Gottesmanbacteria bacterium]|nr:prepilin-type N-terminal cleavage/methylation domain-containing protein [Candidatus Gottesmanbacteria bacterium]
MLSDKGFTIIELLVSIAVIFMLMGFVFASYARLNQRQTLLAAGQTMKNILRDAQSRAYTGEMDCNYCDCPLSTLRSLNGWYVDFPNSKIYGECKNKTGLGDVQYSNKPFGLHNEVIITPYITPAAADRVLIFRYNPVGVDKSATICLSTANLSDSYYKIIITQAGEISDTGKLESTCP